jgi:hypothetical protein
MDLGYKKKNREYEIYRNAHEIQANLYTSEILYSLSRVSGVSGGAYDTLLHSISFCVIMVVVWKWISSL